MSSKIIKSKTITTRFLTMPCNAEEAVNVLGCARNDLVVAGTLAEIERRMKEIERGSFYELVPCFLQIRP